MAKNDFKIADKDWRLRHLYHIVNKESQKVLFKPNFAQDAIRNSPNNRKLILKSRQIGVTTGEVINALDTTMFTENFNTVIMAHEDKVIEKIFRIPRRAFDELDPRIQPRLDRGGGSKYAMSFPEVNSRIGVALSAVGETINWLHISEAALIKDPIRIKQAIECVPLKNGRVTFETTARGLGNMFYDLWNAEDDIHDRLFFPWYLFNEYKMPVTKKLIYTEDEKKLIAYAKKEYGFTISQQQIQFRRFKKLTLLDTVNEEGERVSFEQEYPEDPISCFLSSGSKIIDLFIIREMLNNAPEPLYIKNGVRVYAEKSRKGHYVIGADTAEGIGRDLCVATVIDCVAKEVVAVLAGHFKPRDFADRLMALTDMYTVSEKLPPTLAVERNNHGHAVLLWLEDTLFHPSLYKHTDDKLGWHTNAITRPIMMNGFTNAVENKAVVINDKGILSECLTLVDSNGKIEADTGKKDDHVMATAIAIQMFLKEAQSVYANIGEKIRI